MQFNFNYYIHLLGYKENRLLQKFYNNVNIKILSRSDSNFDFSILDFSIFSMPIMKVTHFTIYNSYCAIIMLIILGMIIRHKLNI